jgi:mono/diheme cytochrome c family protein
MCVSSRFPPQILFLPARKSKREPSGLDVFGHGRLQSGLFQWNMSPRHQFSSVQAGCASSVHASHIGIRSSYMMSTCDLTASISSFKFIAPVALLLAGFAIVTTARSAAAQGRELRPPAFTEEQVQRGRAIYQKNCQDCHGSTLDNGEFGGAPLKGSYFRQHWGSGDVSALFGYVNTLMPPDRPGQLTAQAYADLTAFLLSNNGYTAGTEELTADQDAQRKMTMKK